jgi:hypothetical protein
MQRGIQERGGPKVVKKVLNGSNVRREPSTASGRLQLSEFKFAEVNIIIVIERLCDVLERSVER